jgi:hypothetical protein
MRGCMWSSPWPAASHSAECTALAGTPHLQVHCSC